jgi:3-oxoacyl-[acyl-carrier-protein] synthase-1
MEFKKLYINNIGMITSSGADAAMSIAAIRAGINTCCETEHIAKNTMPMKMARLPKGALEPLNDLVAQSNDLSPYKKRLIQLAKPALLETCHYSALKMPGPLFLAGPQAGSDGALALNHTLLHALHKESGVEFNLENSRLINTGRTGGHQAIELAFKYMESTNQDYVLVGGVDSYEDCLTLGRLDEQNRVLTTGRTDGFAPGEAAGFLLLMSEKAALHLNKQNSACLYRPGFADEPGHMYSDEPYRGDGLANAVRTAVAQSDGNPISTVYSSMNGENFWAKEMGVSFTRNQASFADGVSVEHPADCIGDIGAAFGPIMVGIISQSNKGHYLALCSSDRKDRAALCMQVN